MVRFLHTSDWQLGMTRYYLGEEAQAGFTQARFEAIRTIGRIATQEGCEFVVVCGDVFESNQVDRKTVARALEIIGTVSVPIYLLPGNHDCLDAASVYRLPTFTCRKPQNVHVLEDCTVVDVRPGVEIVGVPWRSRRPLGDLVASACGHLEPARGKVRICVAHGAVDTLAPDRDNPALIQVLVAEDLLAAEHIHFLALGDRHSLTPVGRSGRIYYSGAPEPTDYDEEAPGQVLIVEVEEGRASVSPRRTGTWRFLRGGFDLTKEADLVGLEHWLGDIDGKDRAIVKLALAGTLPL